MLDSTSLAPDDWSGLISRVAGDLDLDALAKETRALVRRRGVPDAKALLRLALARGPGGMSLRQTAAWAHLSGVADLTDASLNDRLHQSCDFLAAIVANLLQAKTPSPCPRWPGRSCELRMEAASASRAVAARISNHYPSNVDLVQTTYCSSCLFQEEIHICGIAWIDGPPPCQAAATGLMAASGILAFR